MIVFYNFIPIALSYQCGAVFLCLNRAVFIWIFIAYRYGGKWQISKFGLYKNIFYVKGVCDPKRRKHTVKPVYVKLTKNLAVTL
jgi:hypothetical protein